MHSLFVPEIHLVVDMQALIAIVQSVAVTLCVLIFSCCFQFPSYAMKGFLRVLLFEKSVNCNE